MGGLAVCGSMVTMLAFILVVVLFSVCSHSDGTFVPMLVFLLVITMRCVTCGDVDDSHSDRVCGWVS